MNHTKKHADIRVSFKGNESKSYVGRTAENVPSGDPTMFFGWFHKNTPDSEYRRVVLHEFGHALGLRHEHQNPSKKIAWNEPKVFAHYRSLGWKDEAIIAFVLNKVVSTNFSEYDPDSIMVYAIPRELTLDGFNSDWNTELSSQDRKAIAKMYPPRFKVPDFICNLPCLMK